MMGYYDGMMGAWGVFGFITWILFIVFLVLGIAHFWKDLNKKR